MSQKRWPRSRVEEALAAYVAERNYAAVSRALGVPERTVAYWVARDRELVNRLIEESDAAYAEDFRKRLDAMLAEKRATMRQRMALR